MESRIIFILSLVAVAQCKLVPLSCKQIRSLVDGHNSRRLQIAKGKIPKQPAASEMKMMLWDDELASKAEGWVSRNHNFHNPDRTIPTGRFTTGENLYWYSTTNLRYELNLENALNSWFSEHENYTYGPLKSSDFDGSRDYDIGHFTQMVWSDSIYLGCAVSQMFKLGWNKYYVVCNYGPGGNYLHEKPYRVSGGASGKLKCGVKDCTRPYGSKCK
ncbi:unnamed protein product [Spodoptera exigua]|nr:unnamed protein product [Spodoptera exigua]